MYGRGILKSQTESVGKSLVTAVLSEVEQLRQAGQAASALQEVVAHQLGRAGP